MCKNGLMKERIGDLYVVSVVVVDATLCFHSLNTSRTLLDTAKTV